MKGFNLLAVLFSTLLFLIPLTFYKNTSELFEFNKIIILYLATVLITGAWAIVCIKQKKLVFRRSLMDVPLILFLAANFISLMFSIDTRVSWLGYYSRFNGGMLSLVCYSLLYWAFVSNISANKIKPLLKTLLISVAIVSAVGFFEHFGIFPTCAGITESRLSLPVNQTLKQNYDESSTGDKLKFLFTTKCWEQDLQNRVFSTIGQPNWLAAILVALLPIIWAVGLKTNSFSGKAFYWFLNILFFTVLLYTKSRSGLLAFVAGSLVFWIFILIKSKLKHIKTLLSLNLLFLILFLTFNPFKVYKLQTTAEMGPALESGGTESGQIRTIVWKGAWEIFKHYPLFGTGPETFAFAYPMFMPKEHNLTSEWNFIYNKAHNEYLNYLATTGFIGFATYMYLIGTIVLLIYKNIQDTNPKSVNLEKTVKSKKMEGVTMLPNDTTFLNIGLLAGVVSILTSNFFGFSVVTVSLLLFLLPAFSVSKISYRDANLTAGKKLNSIQILLILVLVFVLFFLIYRIYIYWKTDVLYNTARLEVQSNNFSIAEERLNKALRLSPNEPVYLNELANIRSNIIEGEDQVLQVLEPIERSIELAPYNHPFKKMYVSLLIKLSVHDLRFLTVALDNLKTMTQSTPNDAALYYQMGLLQLKLGFPNNAIESISKSVELKPNFVDARFALGVVYKDQKLNTKAIEQFEYILSDLDPENVLVKKQLDELK